MKSNFAHLLFVNLPGIRNLFYCPNTYQPVNYNQSLTQIKRNKTKQEKRKKRKKPKKRKN